MTTNLPGIQLFSDPLNSQLAIKTAIAQLLAHLSEQDSALSAVQLGQAAGVIGYGTLAALNADLAHPDGTVAYVTNDTINTNNGIYLKSGASGGGSWTKSTSDPYSQATAAINAVAEVATERFVYGKQVIAALLDFAGRSVGAWSADGVYLGKLDLSFNATSLLGATFDYASGSTLLELSNIEQKAMVQYIRGDAILMAFTDSLDRVLLALLERGAVYIPSLELDTLLVGGVAITGSENGIAESSEYVFYTESIAGSDQIVRKARGSGVRHQMTYTGSNRSPSIGIGGGYITYASTRTIPPTWYWQPTAGGSEHPVESTGLLVPFGNSISTAGLGYATAFSALRPSQSISIQGVGGQRSDDITYRVGATPFTCSVAGASIPASGSVSVSGLGTTLFRRTSGTASVRATISGIPGTLSVAGGVYAFTRTTAGSATAVTNPVSVTITSGFNNSSTDASAQPELSVLLDGTIVLWVTYNDIAEATYNQNATLANVANIISVLTTLVKRLIVVGDMIGQNRLTAAQFPANPLPPPDEVTSQMYITNSIALNSALAAAYPDSYVDMQDYMLANGYTSVFSVNGTDYDIVNLTVLPDGVHPTGSGSAIVAGVINAAYNQKGWI